MYMIVPILMMGVGYDLHVNGSAGHDDCGGS